MNINSFFSIYVIWRLSWLWKHHLNMNSIYSSVGILNEPESGWQMYGHVLVSLFETTVFSDIVQIVTTNNDGTLHFQLLNNSVQNTTTDAHVSSEWAFVVDVCAIHCLTILITLKLLDFISKKIETNFLYDYLPLLVSWSPNRLHGNDGCAVYVVPAHSCAVQLEL